MLEKRDKQRVVLSMYVDIMISILAIISIIVIKNDYKNLKYLGIIILLISIYQFIKVRNNTALLILFGIITYINIAVSLGDLIEISSPLGEITQNWQRMNRQSEYNAIAAKCIILVMSVLNLCINSKFIFKIKDMDSKIKPKSNKLIFWCGLIILIIFWAFGYANSKGSSYESNTRTIYEYCIIIFIVVWYFSGKSKYKLYLLYSYAGIYVLQAIMRGDRSSAFPMVLVLLVISFPKINIKTIVSLALIGMLASNIISVYRESFSLAEMRQNYFSSYSSSVLTSDTVSQSYYTSIAIVKTGEYLTDKNEYFLDFLVGIIAGGNYRNADIGGVVSDYEMHRGGGFYYSWFYFFFGYLGVIVASIILGFIIRISFASNRAYMKLLKIGIIAMSFRWYLYTPFVLFRSIIFIFLTLLLVTNLLNKISR